VGDSVRKKAIGGRGALREKVAGADRVGESGNTLKRKKGWGEGWELPRVMGE